MSSHSRALNGSRALPAFSLTAFLVLAPHTTKLMSQVEWTASDQNPVFGLGEPGAWDSVNVFANWLILKDGQYELWYAGSSAPCCVGLQVGCATSSDLVEWERCPGNPTVLPSVGQWDEGLGGVCVRYDPGQAPPYKMWYTGWTGDLIQSTQSSIGCATSQDGRWTKYAGNPVLKPSPTGGWDSSSVAWPSVIFDETRSPPVYRMWYTGHTWGSCSSPRFGYAESADGIDWRKYEGNPVLIQEGTEGYPYAAKVLHDADSGTFEMWYSAYCAGGLYYATSLDGTTWTKNPGNPLPIQGDFANWPTGPVLRDGNLYHMIYPRSSAGEYGYATCPWTLPRASFTATPETGEAPLTVTFDAARSTAPAGPIAKYSWDFGDGETAEGKEVEHTYAEFGEYLVQLTVTDGAGAQGSVARKVFVCFPSEPVAPWAASDVGEVSAASKGGARPDGACLEVLGAVGNIAGTADAVHFVHRQARGDFCLAARVAAWDVETTGSKVGLMARGSLDAGAPQASVVVEKSLTGLKLRFLRRLLEGETTQATSAQGNAELDIWLRLERRGDELIASSSPDGVVWTELSRATVEMPPEVEVGVAAADARGPQGRDYALARVCDPELVDTNGPIFRRADANADRRIDLSDAVYTLRHLFSGDPAPECEKSADANDDGRVDVSDPIHLLASLFLGGPEPPPPFQACGSDPTEDSLACASHGPCLSQ